jgi:hypothetical protein
MRKGLIRKAHLAHNMKKWAAKHPGGVLAAAVPETYILSVDDEDYIDEALCDLPEVQPAGQSNRQQLQWCMHIVSPDDVLGLGS